MAPKHSSSSDSESTSSDDSDLQPQQPTQAKPTQAKPHQESSESSESETDSESDSSSDKTQKTPSVVSPKPKKPISKSTPVKANGKRPAETEKIDKVSKSKSVEKLDTGLKNVEKGSKKRKANNGEEDVSEIEDKKAAFPFARLFTEKDEIVLLEGTIDFKDTKGADPSCDIVAFHQSVEGLLSRKVTKNQIADKLRRLKKKFMNNARRGQNGEDPVFSRPHEYKSFMLSKKIWESEVEADGDSMVKSGRKKDKKDDNVGSKTPVKSVGKKESDIEEEVTDKTRQDIWSLYPCLCKSLEAEAAKNFTGPMSPKDYVKMVVSEFDKEKARELEQEWEEFFVMERQVYAKRMKVLSKQAEASMNVIHQ